MSRKRFIAIAAVLAVGCLFGGARYFPKNTLHPYPPGVKAVRDVATMQARLENATASERLELSVLGEVQYDDFRAPFWHVALRPTANQPPTHRVLLTGGVHGNEPAGAEGVVQLIEHLAEHPELYAGHAIDMLPLVNPWGWTHGKRRNHDGIDINRSFAAFETQESALVRDFVKDKTYDLVIDHHEAPGSEGFFFFMLSREDGARCRRVIDRLKEQGHPIDQEDYFGILCNDDGILPVPRWMLCFVSWVRQLALTQFCRIENTHRALVVETPRRLPLKDRVAMHRLVQDVFLD